MVLDTSTPAATAALAEVTPDGVVPRAERQRIGPRAHGEVLAPQIDGVLAEAGVRPTDLGAVVAGLGPGPFTGLRVGLVTAATMGQALRIPTYGVCSLDAIGHVAAGQATAGGVTGRAAAGGDRILVAGDARRREIYWAVYDGTGERLVGPDVDRPDAVVERIAELGVTAAVGDGAHRYAEELGLSLRDEPRYPPAYALVELAAERIRAGAPGEALTPLYLRRPDAVAATTRKPVLP